VLYYVSFGVNVICIYMYIYIYTYMVSFSFEFISENNIILIYN